MPNHITNKLTVIGSNEEVMEVLNFIKDDEKGIGSIDFNKITPMPRWIYGSSPDVTGISSKDEEKWGQENTCLEWSRKHWGTKWNAYGQMDERNTDDTIYFQTAWSGVPELIQKIAWIFPHITIEYSFADEDFGSSNNGMYTFKENEISEEIHYVSQSKEAYELSFDLVEGGLPSWYRFSKELNNYVYLED